MAETTREDAIARAGLTADLLALGRPVDLWSSALALLVLAVLLLGANAPRALFISVALAGLSKAYALRVRLDEAVFRRWRMRWAQMPTADSDADMAAFDRCSGRPALSRPLKDRCRGARRLLAWQMLYALLQTACVAIVALIPFTDT